MSFNPNKKQYICDLCSHELLIADEEGTIDIYEECLGAVCLMCSKCKTNYMTCGSCSDKLDDLIDYEEEFYSNDEDVHIPPDRKLEFCKFVGKLYSYFDVMDIDGMKKYFTNLSEESNDLLNEMKKETYKWKGYKNNFCVVQPNKTQEYMEKSGEIDEYLIDKVINYLPEDALNQYKDETENYSKVIQFYVGHLDIKHTIPDMYLLGPDGGFSLVWKCMKCKQIFETNDK